MRTIVKAAIRVKDKIYTGFDHGECFNCAEFPIPVEDLEQGFITSDGDFVDRKQAMIIAKEADQLRYETDKHTLISEDLHIDWLHKQENKTTELGKEIAIRNQKLNELKTELHKRDESLQRKKQQIEDVHKAMLQAKKESTKKGREVCKANNEMMQHKKRILELEEQLKNAIVPKFKINEDVYIIWHGMVIDVEVKAIGDNEYYVDTCHFDLAEGGGMFVYKDGVFKTKEEAETRLKEIESE